MHSRILFYGMFPRIFFAFGLIAVFALLPSAKVSAGISDNITGWAWSENIGWISMNCYNDFNGDNVVDDNHCTGTNPANSQPYTNYGVTSDANGHLSGFAWSENIGWITMNPAGPFPASANAGLVPGHAVQLDRKTGKVTGWARALAYQDPEAGGWDGWIGIGDGGTYGSVKVTSSGNCLYQGWAWGGDVIGWTQTNPSRGVGMKGSGDACLSAAPTNAPAVTLTATPASVSAGGSSALNWNVTNATSCTASGGWSGTKDSSSGSEQSGPINTTTTFTLTCVNAAVSPQTQGSGSATVTVSGTQAPSVALHANPSSVSSGGSSMLTWSSTNATSCTASGGWSGTKALSNNAGESTGALTTTTVYTITCTNSNVSPAVFASDSATVAVQGNSAPSAQALISIDNSSYQNQVTVTQGVPVNMWLSASGSSDANGWTNTAFGVASGGKCEWNSNLDQLTSQPFDQRVDQTITNPASPSACNISLGSNRFNDQPGTYTYDVLRITDAGGLKSNIATVKVTVEAPFDFSLSANDVSVHQGSFVLNTITAGLVSGTSRPVALQFPSSANGITYSWQGGSSCSPGCSRTLRMNASANTPVGFYDITITGANGSLQHTKTFRLEVRGNVPLAPLPGSFAVGVSECRINRVSWNSSIGATYYNVYRCGGFCTPTDPNDFKATTTAASYNDTSISYGVPYSYGASACNNSGCSSITPTTGSVQNVAPVVDITLPPSIVINQVTTFVGSLLDGSVASWSWSFDGGATLKLGQVDFGSRSEASTTFSTPSPPAHTAVLLAGGVNGGTCRVTKAFSISSVAGEWCELPPDAPPGTPCP